MNDDKQALERSPKPDFEPSAEWSNPSELRVIDLHEGEGEELVETEPPGSLITVDYLCFDAETGFELESTWEREKPVEYYLGSLIDCWSEGLLGMRVGGRRVLLSPPDKAYGGVGYGHPKSGRALIYLVDLLKVK